MKGLIILSNGFEDVEALATIDLLRRAKITIDMVSIDKDLSVQTSHGVIIQAEKTLKDINLNDYSFLVIPGGKAVFNTLVDSRVVESMVEFFNKKNQLIACICAAPMVLGKMGLLRDKEYVCYPGCENETFEGTYKENENVVRVDNIITSKACGTVFDFALEIIDYLLGSVASKRIKNEIYFN